MASLPTSLPLVAKPTAVPDPDAGSEPSHLLTRKLIALQDEAQLAQIPGVEVNLLVSLWAGGQLGQQVGTSAGKHVPSQLAPGDRATRAEWRATAGQRAQGAQASG